MSKKIYFHIAVFAGMMTVVSYSLETRATALATVETSRRSADSPHPWYLWNQGEPFVSGPLQGHPGKARADIHISEAWQIFRPLAQIKVAVVDTDFDIDNPRLNGVLDLQQQLDETGAGWIQAPLEVVQHGTMVLGLIGARASTDDSLIGLLPYQGSPSLTPVKLNIMDLSMTAIAKALTDAVDSGAKVINCSFGFSLKDPADIEVLRSAVRYALSKEILIIAAAGNDGTSLDFEPVFPAFFTSEFDNVISVGASNRLDEKASISNYSQIYVDLFAPGEEIPILTRDGLMLSKGTSEAAPIVAAIAALIKEENPLLTPSQMKAILLQTADKNAGLAAFSKSGGRVNAYAALVAALSN
jgi:thermitase